MLFDNLLVWVSAFYVQTSEYFKGTSALYIFDGAILTFNISKFHKLLLKSINARKLKVHKSRGKIYFIV